MVFLSFAIKPDSSLAANAESKLSIYTNPTYGFSFRYPSDWHLKEGDHAELNWGYLGPVRNALPRAIRVAAIVAPQDPEDNFVTEFLSVSVATDTTAKQCAKFVFPDPYDFLEPGNPPTVKIGTIRFAQGEDREGGAGHQFIARYYHVLQNQACYEFQLGVDEIWTNLKPREIDDSFRDLEAVLATLTIRSTTITPPHLKEK